MNTKPTQACWWLIGKDQDAFPLAIAIDLHDAEGNLCAETFTAELRGADPEEFAAVYAAKHGVSDVYKDEDSTEFYAHD